MSKAMFFHSYTYFHLFYYIYNFIIYIIIILNKNMEIRVKNNVTENKKSLNELDKGLKVEKRYIKMMLNNVKFHCCCRRN